MSAIIATIVVLAILAVEHNKAQKLNSAPIIEVVDTNAIAE